MFEEMDLGPMPDLSSWTIWDARFTRARIVAALVAGADQGRFCRAEAKLVWQTVIQAEKTLKLDPTDMKLAERIRLEREWLTRRERQAIRAGAPGYYRRKLYFRRDRARNPREIREVLTAGLIVRSMQRISRTEGIKFTSIARAYELIRGPGWNGREYKNDHDMKVSWSNRKPVAHLSAALAVLVEKHQLQVIDRGLMTILRDEMPEFLSIAKAFQDFLLRPVGRGDKPLVSAEDLRVLPLIDGLTAAELSVVPLSRDEIQKATPTSAGRTTE